MGRGRKPFLYAYESGLVTLRRLANLAGCSCKVMKQRLQRMPSEDAVACGKRAPYTARARTTFAVKRIYEYKGEMRTLTELAKIRNCDMGGMLRRLRKMSVEQAVEGVARSTASGYPARTELHEYNGQKLTVSQLAKIAGCTHTAMIGRIRAVGVDKAVAMGANIDLAARAPKHSYKGEMLTMREGAKRAGCSRITFKMRMHCGHTFAEAVDMGAADNKRPKSYVFHANIDVSDLASRANCSVAAMRARLRYMTPEQAVAITKKGTP